MIRLSKQLSYHLVLIVFLVFFFSFSLYTYAGQNENIPVVLIDAFSKVSSFHNLIGGDEERPGLCIVSYESDPERTLGGSESSLKLSYDVARQGAFSYFYIKLGAVEKRPEMESFEYLSFWVKGGAGGESFKIELHEDSNNNGNYEYGVDGVSSVYVSRYLGRDGITSEYKKVAIPLKDFSAIKDFDNVFEIVFTFEGNLLQEKNGTIYIDDILLGCLELDKDRPGISATADRITVDGTLLEDGRAFGGESSLSVRTDPENIEVVWFEISKDNGRTWMRASEAYNSGTEVFSSEWDSSVLAGKRDLRFRAVAVTPEGKTAPFDKVVCGCSIKDIAAKEFLDALERKAFQYFLDNQSGDTGLFRDTAGRGDASIAVTGMGLTAICIGVERGWIDRDDARRRVLKAVRFFARGDDAEGPAKRAGPPKKKEFVEDLLDLETTKTVIGGIVSAVEAPVKGIVEAVSGGPDRIAKDGFFYHFLDYDTGARAGRSEISTVDTALLLCGLITAGEYFGGDIKRLAKRIYSDMNWPAFQDGSALDGRTLFFMGWTPEKGFLDGRWDYFSDETILVTLLALGSPSKNIPGKVFYDWKREKGCYGGGDPFIYSWYGALFSYQYAHLWFDLRSVVDSEGVNWFENSALATLANRRFCIDNSAEFKTYGPQTWGISSALLPKGYTMSHGSIPNGDRCATHDGTVAPLGMAASISFAPFHVLSSLRYLDHEYPLLRGKYGLKNSFNLKDRYFAPTDYGLDLGAFLIALENFRSGFVWKYFMKNEFVKKAVEKAGFDESISGPDALKNDETVSALEEFISKDHPGDKDIVKANRSMEALISEGSIEAFRVFDKYEGIVYPKIHKRLDEDQGSDAAFLRFNVYARQFNFKEADRQFRDLIDPTIAKNKSPQAKADKLKYYIKRLLSMRVMEGYMRDAYAEYLKIAGDSMSGGATDGIKELAECAFYNNAYEEAASFYGSYFRRAARDMSPREYTAMCGRIAQRFFSIEKYELASEFDLMKIKSLISNYPGEPAIFNVVEEDMMRYFNSGSYMPAKRIADIVVLDCDGVENGMALLVRGQCYRKMKKLKAAVEDFSAVIDQNSDEELRAIGMLQLGESYMIMGEDKLARECFNKVLSGDPNNDAADQALFNQGLMCYYDNDLRGAREYFEKIIENNGSLRDEARKYLVRIGGEVVCSYKRLPCRNDSKIFRE
ncbi:glucoamylase family protein [Candidatus Auribacterota bacterium]